MGRNVKQNDEYNIRKRIELLEDYSQVAQAARDGIIIKQERRQEKVDGQLKEIVYDTSMTPREAINILSEYSRQADIIQLERLDSYLGLGLGLAGMVGILTKSNSTENNNKKTANLISLGTTAITGVKTNSRHIKRK